MPRRSFRRRLTKSDRRRNAQDQIDKLLAMAMREATNDSRLAKRHALLAWRLATRYNLKLRQRRRLYCHFCKEPLLSMLDSRVRIRNRELVVTCFKCGGVYHKKLGRAT